MDNKAEIAKDLQDIETTREKLVQLYDAYFKQYNDNCGADEEEFDSDLAVAHDLLNMETLDEKFPSAIYFADLKCQVLNLENALKILNSNAKKSNHDANEALETCVSSIRQMKERIKEQIDDANQAWNMLDECLDICDKYRK